MDRTRDTERPKRRWWGVGGVLALVASLVFVGPASASHEAGDDLPAGVEFIRTRADGTEVYRMPTLFFYDNTTGEEHEFLVMIGGDMWDVCGARPGNEGGTPGQSRVLVKESRNGTTLVKSTPSGHTSYVSVYRTTMIVPEFFGSVCGGFFENGNPIPPPYATGSGTIRHKSWVTDVMEVLDDRTPQPIGRYRNGIEGVVVDVDGNLFDVRTEGVFRVRDPQGPPDFTTMTASLTPHAG
ncbi:MAG: hypothetical protein ACR2P0_01400 [Acidimicrobiales bacterium]